MENAVGKQLIAKTGGVYRIVEITENITSVIRTGGSTIVSYKSEMLNDLFCSSPNTAQEE